MMYVIGKVEHDDGYTKSARRMVSFEEGVTLAQELHIYSCVY